jgi:hypothetical protein
MDAGADVVAKPRESERFGAQTPAVGAGGLHDQYPKPSSCQRDGTDQAIGATPDHDRVEAVVSLHSGNGRAECPHAGPGALDY